jgi:predicted TIM-barrel fold metal-dependent hydrolase
MQKLTYFDINGVVGYPILDTELGQYYKYSNSKDLLDDMDYFGIEYSLVSHHDCKKFDPMIGNYRLLEEISDEKRLYPCWVIIPSNTRNIWQVKNIISEIKKNEIKAVRMLPGIHNFSLEIDYTDRLLLELERNHILLIIEYKNLGLAVPMPVEHDMVVLDRICSKYADLKIVSSGPLRQFYPLLEKHDNLFISLEWEPHSCMVEDICMKFGPERILFGTPNCEIASRITGAAISMLTYSDIGKDDKKKVAGGNLIKLLRLEDQIGSFTFNSKYSNDSFIAKTHKGESFNTPIIDCHYHVGEFSAEYKPGGYVDKTLALFKKNNLEKICINSSEAVFGGNYKKGNSFTLSLCKKYPDKFLGFYVFNPNFTGSSNEMIDYLENRGFVGVKIHPRIHQCDLSDNRYNPVWEASIKYRIPILAHTGEGQAYSDPAAFIEISKRYPDGIFILGHGGESFVGINKSIEIVNCRENVFIDISGWGFMHKGVLEYVVKKAGADKLLFGSDAGWIDFNFAVGVVSFAVINNEEKKKILGENIKKLL